MKRTQENLESEDNRLKRLSYNTKDTLKECECGIDCYLNDFVGIQGILKGRFEDFIVQEIGFDNKPVELISTKLPDDKIVYECNTSEEGLKKLKEIYDESVITKMNEYINKLAVDPKCDEGFELEATIEKEQRKSVHEIIRNFYPMLLSDTNSNGHIVIYSFGNPEHRKRLQRNGWLYKDKEYVLFTLKKTDSDTISCLNNLAYRLRRKPNIFGYNGVKDKRAITYQKITAYKVKPNELAGAAKSTPGCEIGDYEYVSKPLCIANGKGNRFTITLRQITPPADDKALPAIIHSLSTEGYLNYYGLQRFGNGGKNINTFQIGAEVLNSNWKTVVEGILSCCNDDRVYKAYEDYLIHKDIKQLCRAVPNKNKMELEMLKAFHNSGQQYTNAMAAIPVKKRSLYVHGLQSYFFNKLLSYRIQHYGKQVIPGDFVLEKDTHEDMHDNDDEEEEEENNYTLPAIHVITEEDKHLYSLKNIVLPLPGTETNIPQYLEGYYNELLESLHLTSSSWNHPIQVYCMKGTYRHILYTPKDIEASIQEDENHDFSLRLAFTLGSGCYATMLLREITRMGTDKNTQFNLERSLLLKKQEQEKNEKEEEKITPVNEQ
ncbi:hypothetical protein WA158_008465 [Blastocystis sp. Blastoise]